MEVEKFIRTYDCGSKVVVPDQYFGGNLASLVVQFFRRCPDDIFTEQYAPVFQKITEDYTSKREPQKQLHMMKKLLTMLPAVNLTTLRVLLEHLRKVAARTEENKMTTAKLAMCVYARMASTVQLCLEQYDTLFDGYLDGSAATPIPVPVPEVVVEEKVPEPPPEPVNLTRQPSGPKVEFRVEKDSPRPQNHAEEGPRGSVLNRVLDMMLPSRDRSASLGRRSRSPSSETRPLAAPNTSAIKDGRRRSTGAVVIDPKVVLEPRRRSMVSRVSSATSEAKLVGRESTNMTVAGFETTSGERSSGDGAHDGALFEKMTAAARRGWSKDFVGVKLPPDIVYIPEPDDPVPEMVSIEKEPERRSSESELLRQSSESLQMHSQEAELSPQVDDDSEQFQEGMEHLVVQLEEPVYHTPPEVESDLETDEF